MKKSFALIVFAIILIGCQNQEKLVLKASQKNVQVHTSIDNNTNNWGLNKDLNPDINTITLKGTKAVRVVYKSNIDSLVFDIKEGTKIDFKIIVEKDTFNQQIIGVPYIPKATYSTAFKNAKKNTIDFSVPELYELVNIIVAITDLGIESRGRVRKKTEYYTLVMNHFLKYKNHKVVDRFNEFIRLRNEYFIRTNGLTYNFNNEDKLVKNDQYNRAVYDDQSPNYLTPFIEDIEDFAKQSNFRSFYNKQDEYYKTVISEIKNNVDVPEMLTWLQRHFPTINYNYHNIVISPLTGYTQGLIMYDNDAFKELQIHVGLPYPSKDSISSKSKEIAEGDIIFSELNHGYLNKEADKYTSKINQALKNKRDTLVTDKFGSGYYGSYTELFKEYMNWGLVALRYIDTCPSKDLELLFQINKDYMQNRRGFKRFPEFQDHLITLYKNREKGSTIADLYPQIIQWFHKI